MISLVWIIACGLIAFVLIMASAAKIEEDKANVRSFCFLLLIVLAVGVLGYYIGVGTPANISSVPAGQENSVISVAEFKEVYLLTLEIGNEPRVFAASKEVVPSELKAKDIVMKSTSGEIRITKSFVEE